MLAYTSVIGLVSSILMIFVVFYDGFMKQASPGSILHPEPTQWLAPIDGRKTGMAFGLFMAGFSGHAVIPSIASDMKEPSEFPRMIKRAFVRELTSSSQKSLLNSSRLFRQSYMRWLEGQDISCSAT
jgi:vesicular inhibitory amino acid transporter